MADEGGEDNILTDSIEILTEQGQDIVSNVHQHYSRDDWLKILFQDGYLKVLKEFAISGELQRSNLRSICWKLFLGCLPEDHSGWIEATKKSREIYNKLKQKYMFDPHKVDREVDKSLDLTVYNPLSLDEESPWNQYFQDSEIRQTIMQDIVRTHPDQMFFKQPNIQNSMLDILFCYAKEYPDIGYRQGMHELLAPILFVLHAESRDDIDTDPSLNNELKVVMNPDYIDADAFTLFSELMEGMQQYFMTASLEADIHKAREQKRYSQNMKHDPRRLPFESDDFAPTSAIGRKLDKIHNVLLKNADEQLFVRLQDLGIPPQTYGIRWIRLLFGREFYLPSVLQLWDALFVDGNSLSLIDHIFVAMLIQIRHTLLTDDYGTCMQLLMKYPTSYEVPDLIQKAINLRNPSANTVAHVHHWTHITDDMLTSDNKLNIQEEHPQVDVIKRSQKFANKTKSVFAQATKQIHIPTKPINLSTKLSLSKSKHDNTATSHPTFNESDDQEMIKNPKSRPRALSEIDRLKEDIENKEAKCLYCGRKMESILEDLQNLVEGIELTEENETPVYLAIAGLKQVRDLLLHKLPFSGELPDYNELTTPPAIDDFTFDHPLMESNRNGEDPFSESN